MSESSFACRSCGAPGLLPILSLGETPLANSLLKTPNPSEPEPRFPLDLVFCPSCTLLQITESVAPERLFGDYVYFSSFSDTMLESVAVLAERLIGERALDGSSLVVEIASNDGYLLQNYARAGIPVVGIEPAANIAAVAQSTRGIHTIVEFFTEELAARLAGEGLSADIVHAHNVLAHVPDPNGFTRGIAGILKQEGVAVIEVPYLKEFLDGCEFDTIYHEHLCYFSLTALDHLFRRHGLCVMDVELIPLHGGSLRLFVGHATNSDGAEAESSPSVRETLAREAEWRVGEPAIYEHFASRVVTLRQELRTLLHRIRSSGHSIAAYGASAKGSTLLNYCGIGAETIDFVVDRSTFKQGHYTPGTHLAVFAPSRLLEMMPDYVLLLTWNFAAEIMQQQAEYLSRGGQFIIPVPEPWVVGMGDMPLATEN